MTVSALYAHRIGPLFVHPIPIGLVLCIHSTLCPCRIVLLYMHLFGITLSQLLIIRHASAIAAYADFKSTPCLAHMECVNTPSYWFTHPYVYVLCKWHCTCVCVHVCVCVCVCVCV